MIRLTLIIAVVFPTLAHAAPPTSIREALEALAVAARHLEGEVASSAARAEEAERRADELAAENALLREQLATFHRPTPPPQGNDSWPIFDALRTPEGPHIDHPDMERIYVVYGEIYVGGRAIDIDTGQPAVIEEQRVRRAARRAVEAGARVIVLDIEHLPLDIRRDRPDAVRQTMAIKGQVIDWIRDEEPALTVGAYFQSPLRDYWTPVRLHQSESRLKQGRIAETDPTLLQRRQRQRNWEEAVEFLRPLTDQLDQINLSLYTFYENQEDWEVYARANIATARRLEGTLVPFIWPMYHGSGAGAHLAGQYVPGDYWRLQLETVRELADGVVIWGHFRTEVDPQSEWWRETERFAAGAESGGGEEGP